MFYSPPEITVRDLARQIATDDNELQLIDVREPEEINIAQIPGFIPLPLSQFSQWNETIAVRFDPEAETIVLCHHGIRSAQMVQWLIERGFSNVKNVTGGIDAYSRMVDRNIQRY